MINPMIIIVFKLCRSVRCCCCVCCRCVAIPFSLKIHSRCHCRHGIVVYTQQKEFITRMCNELFHNSKRSRDRAIFFSHVVFAARQFKITHTFCDFTNEANITHMKNKRTHIKYKQFKLANNVFK